MPTLAANSSGFRHEREMESAKHNQRALARFCHQPLGREQKRPSLSKGLAALLLLVVTAPLAGQEILPRRAEPLERMRERHQNPLNLDLHYGDPDYKRRLQAPQDELNGWSTQKRMPDAPFLLWHLDDDWSYPVVPKGKVTINLESRKDAMRSLMRPAFLHNPVWIAQQRLAELGYLDPIVDVDGKIGPRTRQGLLKYQSENGLHATGDLDPATKATLNPKTLLDVWFERNPLRLGVEGPIGQNSNYGLHDESGNLLFESGNRLQAGEDVKPPGSNISSGERLPGETDTEYQHRTQLNAEMKDKWRPHPSPVKPNHPLSGNAFEPAKTFGKVHLNNPELKHLNAEHPEAAWLTIEYRPGSLDRFYIWDESGMPTLGNDASDVIGQAIDKVGKAGARVVIGFKGFQQKEIDAFSAELNVKQELQDGSTPWRPILNTDGSLRGLYQERGTKVDGVILDQTSGWWRARARFSNSDRKLWVQTLLANAQYLKEYVASLLLSNSNDRSQSAQEMVEKSKRQLMVNNPGLTEKQIYMNIREEIEQSHLGEMPRRREEAA
jgi:hypothetical protein